MRGILSGVARNTRAVKRRSCSVPRQKVQIRYVTTASKFNDLVEFPSNETFNESKALNDEKKANYAIRRAGAPLMFSSYTVQGLRNSMEDRYASYVPSVSDGCLSLFGVYDGHAGDECAQYLTDVLIQAIKVEIEKNPAEDPKAMFERVFLEVDKGFCDYARGRSMQAGSSALVVMIEREPTMGVPIKAWFASAGDSRAVVVRKSGTVKQMNRELSPELKDERKRVHDEGGFVKYDFPLADDGDRGTLRVNGVLAMSRAFGNYSLKPFVTAKPEVTMRTLRKDDMYICLASDGLWERIDNEDVAEHMLQYGPRIGAEKLTKLALKRGSTDNITVQAIGLVQASSFQQPGDDD